MKTPFPGMDPFLEHPLLWPGLHVQLIVHLASQLQPLIKPRYVASIEERIYIEGPEWQRVPDVLIKRAKRPSGNVTVAELVADKPLLLEVANLEIRERRVEILDLYNDQKLVTLIELVSPSNKVRGLGRKSYRAKQRDTLSRDCHLVEIDLLRRGRHVLSVPGWRLNAVPSYAYLACVNRWPRRNVFEIYARALRERLPRISVPLGDGDPDVPLDVQTALEIVYQDGSYMLRVKYDEPCIPRLKPDDQPWADECWAVYKSAHPEWFASASATS